MKDSRRSARRLGILLVGALLLAPGLGWAVEEDIQEKESGAKAPVGKKVDEKKASKPAQAAETAESGKKGSGALDPSFNTLEDIAAFRGSLAALWAGQPVAVEDPSSAWREVVPPEQPAPPPAPLGEPTAR